MTDLGDQDPRAGFAPAGPSQIAALLRDPFKLSHATQRREDVIRYGHEHHLKVAARILFMLKALPFDEALSVLAIVCRCATDRAIQGRFWTEEARHGSKTVGRDQT